MYVCMYDKFGLSGSFPVSSDSTRMRCREERRPSKRLRATSGQRTQLKLNPKPYPV